MSHNNSSYSVDFLHLPCYSTPSKSLTHHPAKVNISAHPSSSPGLRNDHPPRFEPSGNHLARTRYSELARKHTTRVLEYLFSGFTGLHFHLLWLPLPLLATFESSQSLRFACCKPVRPTTSSRCRGCLARVLPIAQKRHSGHKFKCCLGVRSFWIPINIRGETLGFAYLQAMKRTSRKGRTQSLLKLPIANQAEFSRAARLLRHIVRHVELASTNELETRNLRQANRTVRALKREEQRLRRALKRLQPAFPGGATEGNAASHNEQIVQAMLDQIQRAYNRPITLLELARDLGMNASYLSALFSSSIGVPFKTYLTEYRMQKAKDLLGLVDKRPSDIAYAVGYTSEERFRAVFKKATGLPPTVWRETMLSKTPDSI